VFRAPQTDAFSCGDRVIAAIRLVATEDPNAHQSDGMLNMLMTEFTKPGLEKWESKVSHNAKIVREEILQQTYPRYIHYGRTQLPENAPPLLEFEVPAEIANLVPQRAVLLERMSWGSPFPPGSEQKR
jgi:hypothetical protein